VEKAVALIVSSLLIAVIIAGCLAPPGQNATASIAPATTPTPTVSATARASATPAPTATATPAPKTVITANCSADEECAWVNTACCGGNWQCVNQKRSVVACPRGLGCPVMINPNASDQCLCASKVCSAGPLNLSQVASRIDAAVNQVLNRTYFLQDKKFELKPAVDFQGTVVSYEAREKFDLNPGSARAAPGMRKIEFMVTVKGAPSGGGGAYFDIDQSVDGRRYYLQRGEDYYDNTPIETKAAFSCGADRRFLVAVNDDISFDRYFGGFMYYDYNGEKWVKIEMRDFVAALLKACP